MQCSLKASKTGTEGNHGIWVPFHITPMVAIILDKRLVTKEGTLVCVGECWEVSSQENLVDLHMNVSLTPKNAC